MRNIIGIPVTGSDYFDRPKILANFMRDLDNLSNILLVAPRRVGKTSLIHRVCVKWRSSNKRKAIYLNVEGKTDELAFVEMLIAELDKSGLYPDLTTKAISYLNKIRKKLGKFDLKVSGFGIGLGEEKESDFSTLGEVLETVFSNIEAGETAVLIVIDELPEFLLSIQKAEGGSNIVNRFLPSLRAWRQIYPKKIRWVFLGSIGLNYFVETQKLNPLIEDLLCFELDAFSDAEANAFLDELGNSNNLPLSIDERKELIQLSGWPLAYYLQLIFHELREQESRSIPEAFESLLKPEKSKYFNTWYQRIELQFPKTDSDVCQKILLHLCRYPAGRKQAQIRTILMGETSADEDKVTEQLIRLLPILVTDGYLQESQDRYTFRSFLLREYWKRKYSP